MRKIIVTGGLGFIGSNLIELLLNKKFNVINIDKISYSSNFYNTKNYINWLRCIQTILKFKLILQIVNKSILKTLSIH